jgi:hypothetical protein
MAFKVQTPVLECPHKGCGHRWVPRIAEVTFCPKCKRILVSGQAKMRRVMDAGARMIREEWAREADAIAAAEIAAAKEIIEQAEEHNAASPD